MTASEHHWAKGMRRKDNGKMRTRKRKEKDGVALRGKCTANDLVFSAPISESKTVFEHSRIGRKDNSKMRTRKWKEKDDVEL